MRLSILIVNWNSKEFLRRCLDSIRRTAGDQVAQVIVVDSGSFDGCGEMLSREFPEVEFVQSTENIGFGRANNLGFRRVSGDAVLLLNPDAELRSGALQTLLCELVNRPGAGIVGPRLLNTDGTLQASVHALPRPVRQALDSEFLRRLLSPYGLWAPPSDYAPSKTVAVEAVSGACMLLWSETFRKLGGFNPRYFMYAEDVDLCLMARRAGLSIYHVPAAEVVHHGGASSLAQGSAFSAVMIREALRSYMVANHGQHYATAYRVAVGVSTVARLLMLLPGAVLGERQRRLDRRSALARWWAVFAWSLGDRTWTGRGSPSAS